MGFFWSEGWVADCMACFPCFFAFLLAAYYVAFGPHGPRAPTSQPGDGVKVFFWTMALVGVAGVLTVGLRSFGVYSCPVLF